MSQTNKEETLTKLREVLDGDYYNKQEEDDAFYNFLTQFATQQTTLAVEEKQRDIEFWKNKHADKVHNLGLANKLSLERWEQLCLKDKEIEELKEKNYVGSGMLKNALRDLDFMQKDRDEYRERYTCNQCTVVNQSARIKELEEGWIKTMLAGVYVSDREYALKYINNLLSGQVDKEERKG